MGGINRAPVFFFLHERILISDLCQTKPGRGNFDHNGVYPAEMMAIVSRLVLIPQMRIFWILLQ